MVDVVKNDGKVETRVPVEFKLSSDCDFVPAGYDVAKPIAFPES